MKFLQGGRGRGRGRQTEATSCTGTRPAAEVCSLAKRMQGVSKRAVHGACATLLQQHLQAAAQSVSRQRSNKGGREVWDVNSLQGGGDLSSCCKGHQHAGGCGSSQTSGHLHGDWAALPLGTAAAEQHTRVGGWLGWGGWGRRAEQPACAMSCASHNCSDLPLKWLTLPARRTCGPRGGTPLQQQKGSNSRPRVWV